MWIITWLVGKFQKLVKILDTYFNRIINAAKNAYKWARDKAEDAYQRAKIYVVNKVAIAKASLKASIAVVKNLAYSLYDTAVSKARKLFDTAKVLWRTAIETASNILKGFLLAKIAAAWAFFRNPVDWLKGKSSLLDKIIEWYDAFVSNPDSLFNRVLALFDTDGKFSIWAWFLANFGSLKSFVENPLRFLIAFWQGYLLEFLQYAIAYGLGTVKYELPPFPDWDNGGFGGPIRPGNPPPPGASGLVPPLNNVYVSGYIFRPGHPAIDLGLTNGTPVYAMHKGTVKISKWSNIGYGFYIAIQGKDWWTLYAHLEVLGVKSGDFVKAGQTIGLGDDTGNSTGPHLHLEIKYKGVYIDPATVL